MRYRTRFLPVTMLTIFTIVAFVTIVAILAAPPTARATVIRVPQDQPTIQLGIHAAAPQETVLVACGIYHEQDIQLASGVILLSETGLADCVTIDARQLGRVIECHDADSETTIEGFTLTGGAIAACTSGAGVNCVSSSPRLIRCVITGNAECNGAGMACRFSSPTLTHCVISDNQSLVSGAGLYAFHSSPVISNCTFIDNRAGNRGGAIYCVSSSPLVTDCLFSGNHASTGGAATFSLESTPQIEHCTFINNTSFFAGGAVVSETASWPVLSHCLFRANRSQRDGGAVACVAGMAQLTRSTFHECCTVDGEGAGLYLDNGSLALLENVIIAGSTGGEAVFCADPVSHAALSCCDLFGNAGGDWVSCIADQLGIEGNISADPLFCDAAAGDFSLHADSPCAPEQAPGNCGLIGLAGVGCGAAGAPGADVGVAPCALRIAPNPACSATAVRWSGDLGARARCRLFDIQGRLVRVRALNRRGSGPHHLSWQAIVGQQPLAAGVYFLQLEGEVGTRLRARAILLD